jgi:Bacterial conjugation TrbI-like protein
MLEFDDQENNSTVNDLLPIDDDKPVIDEDDLHSEDNLEEQLEEDPASVQTKHDFITSPWSRLGIIGGAFGVGFLVMFAALNSIMGGGSRKAQDTKFEPTPTSTKAAENKDGEILSKLALQKQEQELDALNNPKPERDLEPEKPKEEVKEKDKKPQAKPVAKTPSYKPRPPQPRYQPQPRRVAETPPPPRRVLQVPSPPPEPRQTRQARTPLPPPPSREAFKPQETKAADPIAELERLRALGNVGRVDYAQQQAPSRPNQIAANSPTPEDVSSVELTPQRPSRRRSNRLGEQPTNSNNNTNNNNIEQLRPRWEPTETEATTASSQAKNVNFSEEDAILQEKKPQYLVVGEYAKATLNTPLLIPQNNTDKEQANNLRFVATLTEPLKGNTNEIAIEAGTEIVISVISVDNSSNMKAEVTAILKDGTEYPISPGTISVLGKEGSPLIARPHNDKGDEIAGYDATLGVISGIAKVGEIINKPDEEITEDLPLGGSRTRTRNNNRNPTGAFIEGFFGSVSEVVGKRTERATQEILSRPNIWVVPQNTEITIQVNRSIKL